MEDDMKLKFSGNVCGTVQFKDYFTSNDGLGDIETEAFVILHYVRTRTTHAVYARQMYVNNHRVNLSSIPNQLYDLYIKAIRRVPRPTLSIIINPESWWHKGT
jgi:hypothetical protein